MRTRVLVADDETPIRKALANVLEEQGFAVTTTADGREAIEQIRQNSFEIALVDIRMPEVDGMEVLARAREESPETQIVIITAFGSVEAAVEAMKMGASDYVTKPFVFDDILMRIERLLDLRRLTDENTMLRGELEERYSFDGIVGSSEALQEVLRLVGKLARTRTSALITGESGTGKELIARAIHHNGVTSEGRFVAVNCAALPETLVESELFGYKKGAFTGPTRDKRGLFEVADNGTVFLDEVSSMSPPVQAKLLRAIEQKRFLPIGGTEPVEVNARVLCATNRNLAEEMKAARFREDLYYRLNVVEVNIPPLRERREDVPALVSHFVAKYERELNKPCAGVTPGAMSAMVAYDWPGNVRELENVIERGLIFNDGGTIGRNDLPFLGNSPLAPPGQQEDLRAAVRAFEREHIIRTLYDCHYNKPEVAEALNIGLSSLYRKMDELGIPKNNDAADAARTDAVSAERRMPSASQAGPEESTT
ncbi:MAG: sigma-54-dependent transcriptional regulator [Planctomycetota bacterium]|jgi:two-component system response regulator PilR (NtrC family)